MGLPLSICFRKFAKIWVRSVGGAMIFDFGKVRRLKLASSILTKSWITRLLLELVWTIKKKDATYLDVLDDLVFQSSAACTLRSE